MVKYKFLEHTADAKFQAYGKTLEEAFENAAFAMFSIMVDTKKIKPRLRKQIKISGKDEKSLLYNFLEELLFLLDAKQFLLNKIENLKINNNLTATLVGDNAENYKIEGDVKAVTYNDMLVEKQKNKYMVQVVVDL